MTQTSTPQILVINTLMPLSLMSVERLKAILGEPFALREPAYGGDDIYRQMFGPLNAPIDYDDLPAHADRVVDRMELADADWALPRTIVLLCRWAVAGIELRHEALLTAIERKLGRPPEHMLFSNGSAAHSLPMVWDKDNCGLGGPRYEWVEAAS